MKLYEKCALFSVSLFDLYNEKKVNGNRIYIYYLFCDRLSDNGLKEWGMVELQGDLEVRGDEVMDNQFIGDLNYDKYGQPVCSELHIFAHILFKHVSLEALKIFPSIFHTDLDHWTSHSTWERTKNGQTICRFGEDSP